MFYLCLFAAVVGYLCLEWITLEIRLKRDIKEADYWWAEFHKIDCRPDTTNPYEPPK